MSSGLSSGGEDDPSFENLESPTRRPQTENVENTALVPPPRTGGEEGGDPGTEDEALSGSIPDGSYPEDHGDNTDAEAARKAAEAAAEEAKKAAAIWQIAQSRTRAESSATANSRP